MQGNANRSSYSQGMSWNVDLLDVCWMIIDLPDNQEKDPRNILLKAANQIKPFNQLRKNFKNCFYLFNLCIARKENYEDKLGNIYKDVWGQNKKSTQDLS